MYEFFHVADENTKRIYLFSASLVWRPPREDDPFEARDHLDFHSLSDNTQQYQRRAHPKEMRRVSEAAGARAPSHNDIKKKIISPAPFQEKLFFQQQMRDTKMLFAFYFDRERTKKCFAAQKEHYKKNRNAPFLVLVQRIIRGEMHLKGVVVCQGQWTFVVGRSTSKWAWEF